MSRPRPFAALRLASCIVFSAAVLVWAAAASSQATPLNRAPASFLHHAMSPRSSAIERVACDRRKYNQCLKECRDGYISHGQAGHVQFCPHQCQLHRSTVDCD